jgi:hypothetical protein
MDSCKSVGGWQYCVSPPRVNPILRALVWSLTSPRFGFQKRVIKILTNSCKPVRNLQYLCSGAPPEFDSSRLLLAVVCLSSFCCEYKELIVL